MNRYEISLPERIKYGLGDFAQNGVFTFMSSYFLFSVQISRESVWNMRVW